MLFLSVALSATLFFVLIQDIIMGVNIKSTKLTKQYILSKVSQVTIFATYLNLSNSIIQQCIDDRTLIVSPLREDIHPTCGFMYDNRGKLKFKDFAGYFWGDCFDLVALVMSNIYKKEYDISKKEDFVKVLKHITFTFKDIFYGKEKDITLINEINNSIVELKNKKNIIELVIRSWNTNDKEYWNRIGVDLHTLNLNFVYPVDQYYINRKINPEPKYHYKDSDPCYAYFLGQDKHGVNNIKLYFPFRTKTTTRFITNCNHLEGIYNLDKNNYDIIVITKSTKDRLAIRCWWEANQSLYGGFSVGLINIPHETYKLRQNEYDWLTSKLSATGRIISLMDNDRTGKIEAKYLKNNYRIIPILIPKLYKFKDFAELVQKTPNDEIVSLVNLVIKEIDYEDYNEYI